MPLDVRASPELAAAVAALADADRTLRTDINAVARRELTPVWTEALRGHVTTRLEARTILPGARVKVTARQVTLVAAASRKPLRGGLVPAVQWPSVELGARQRPRTFESTSPKGKRYKVKRMQGRQFRPRTGHGYVAFPAASLAGRRIVAGWVHVVIAGFEADWEVKHAG